MQLGIDFGTTHTTAALIDRGNYPTVGYEWGDVFPSLAALEAATGAWCFGPDAVAFAEQPGWRPLRSFKRLLDQAGPLAQVELAGHRIGLVDLLVAHFTRLRQELVEGSTAAGEADSPIEVAVSVPANASSDQRFLTLDAFRRAGFEVVALLNEPSATGFEYAHRFRRTVTSKREHVLVYDLGGGTFDVSLIHMAGLANEVLATAGAPRLGGDDFDETILARVLDRAALVPLEAGARRALLDECRRQKERLTPQSRRFVLDLSAFDAPPLSLPVEELYEACRPLVDRTVELVEEVLAAGGARAGIGWDEVASLYVAGGASSFPPILRQLRERYGERRVRRSPHPFAATAIGLACFLDGEAGVALSDVLSRTFGVFRESAEGREVAFDPIFLRDTPLPQPGAAPLAAVRRYRPAHNVGHFRYVECGRLRDGIPDGHLAPWDEIRFPFDPRLRERPDLERVPVERVGEQGPLVEERYSCTPAGTFEVALTCLEDGWSRRYDLGRHHDSVAVVE